MKWKEIKKMVLERDKKCRKCGSQEKLTVDHIIPLSRGGTDIPGNLLTLCQSCNQSKSSFIEWDFVRRIRIAMYADELVLKATQDLKGMITSSVGVAKNHANDVKSWVGEVISKKLTPMEERIAALEAKLKALETYHKLEFVKEVEVFEGYKKVKPMNQPTKDVE